MSKELDELDDISRLLHPKHRTGECLRQTGYKQSIQALISTAVREARIDEIKRYREAMTFAHITPSIYAAERIPELLNEEQL